MIRYCQSLLLLTALALSAGATQVRIFATRSQAAFLQGDFKGISVDPLGTLRLANRVEQLATVDEPFLLSAAAHPEGWVVGTGNQGRVLKIDRQGRVTLLFNTEEPEVFTVWADQDGTVFAGSSPDGKVYRFAGGSAEVFFDPGQTYIWGLVRGLDGSLCVATGTEGKLFKVGRGGDGELVYDSEEPHLRSLAVLDGGEILIGTAGEGLVLHLDAEGNVRTLFDAAQPEVVGFAVAGDGTRYVATQASEASLVDLSRGSPQRSEEQAQGGEASSSESPDGPKPKITVDEGGEAPPSGSRVRGYRGPRSEVLRLNPSGAAETVWTFEGETVFSLAWQQDRLWVGTGLEGKIYSYQGEQMVLEKDVDERQVVALLADEPGPAFATTNAAAFYRVIPGKERQGAYTSSVLDAGQVSRFGSVHWDGEIPDETGVRFSFHSGLSSEPDQTWSDWTQPKAGREISLDDLAPGRYLQWRAELSSKNGASPRISAVEISYLRENLRPLIERFAPLDPGQILVPANFNPSNQTFEPAHPNRGGIFTSVGDAKSESPGGRLKTLWKMGYRTLRWQAKDPNDDELTYELAFRRDGDPEGWLPMAKDLDRNHYSFDATVLPDGVYRFELEASDQRSNLPRDALAARQTSERVVIDNGLPELESTRRQGKTLHVRVKDALSPLREVVASADAGEWKPVKVGDELLDGRSEELLIDVGEGTRLLLIRVTDAAFNVVTFDLSEGLP